MKSVIGRLMLPAAFVVGLAVPLAATWSTPVQAFEEVCTFLSGRDTWSGTDDLGNSFTVKMTYNGGVTLTGTPPSFSSLPMVLVSSTSGHSLTISQSGTLRKYEGTFTAETNEACIDPGNCPNAHCQDTSDYDCTYPTANGKCVGVTICTSTTCDPGGGGSCTGGVCTGNFPFSARF